MKKGFLTLGIAAALLSVTACQSSPTTLPPGKYSTTKTTTGPNGAETTRSTETKVYYDETGDKRAVEKTETTHDPEGWFNKSTTTTTRTYD